MSDVIKSGYVKRFSKSFMDGGWKKIWLILHKNSKLELFKKQSDSTPKGHVMMKDVCKYFAYGEYTDNMPDRPTLPKDGKKDWLLAVPLKPSSQSTVHWFLFDSDKELSEWMQAIVSTLPPVPSHHQASAPPAAPQPQPVVEPVQAVTSNPVSAPLPPAGYPSQPPPYSAGVGPMGFDQLHISQQRPPPPAGGYYPPQQGYPGAYPQQPAYQPPPQQYQQPYPTQQPYPQQPYYPQQPAGGSYPRQPYAAAPAQGYYTPQGQYVAYPQGQYAQYPQGQYVQQQPNVVVVKEKKNKGILGGSTASTAAGLAGGALLGYGAARMMGGPFGYGGFGMGRWGSWSSLSSCGSFGSFSSFGSWD